MEKSRSIRRNQTNANTNITPKGRPQSPHLIRSRSGTSNISASPDFLPSTPNYSIRNSPSTTTTTISRSTSTTKSRKITKREENSNSNLVGILSQRYQIQRISDATTGVMKSSNNNNTAVVHHHYDQLIGKISTTNKQRSRSATNSPSAWALSPGRAPPQSPMSKSVDKAIGYNTGGGGGGGGGVVAKAKSSGGVSGVLKYFRSNNKKVSLIQEEAFHRFRVFHTRLIQWRFMNARAEIAIVNRNSVAEKKLLNVWLRSYQLRNSVIEKRMQVQKLKNEIKLLRIINPEIRLLNEWNRIEKRNSEAVAKLSRNLDALSVRLPLIKGAQADTVSVYRVMYTALNVMNDIEETMEKSFFQVEETVLLVNELMDTIRLETEGLQELRNTVSMVAALEAQEKSLRVYVIQAAKDQGRLVECY